jgi:hypothetical protein
MQLNTIEKCIKSKLNEWLETIEDDTLRKSVKDNLLVSGGSITSMLLNEPVNDYDIYLKDFNVLKSLTEYYIKNFNNEITLLDGREKQKLIQIYNTQYEYLNPTGVNAIESINSYTISLNNLKEDQLKLFFSQNLGGYNVDTELQYKPVYFSPNAISLSDNIQIVLRFWGTSEQIHKTFDFIHATNYFTFSEGLVRNLSAIESILTKKLIYQGSFYPVTSIIRAKKFIKRGFNISAGEMLKIMFQISSLDLTDPNVLEEQLIGVDVAYFDLLITTLRNKFEKNPKFELSNNYFNKLIDKIFNEDDETIF